MYIDLSIMSKVSLCTLLRCLEVVHTLLLENSSFTPRPELLCMIVLYSPSSLSLRS